MTNKEKLFEDINPHTQYWDCHRDEPIEYDHTGKVIKICKKFTVSFSLFCVQTYTHLGGNDWSKYINGELVERTTEELMKIYLNRERL